MYYSYVRMRNKLYTAYKCGHNSDINTLQIEVKMSYIVESFCGGVHCNIFNKDLSVTITSCT